MRAPRLLASLARTRAKVRRMNELDRVVRHVVEQNAPSGGMFTDNSSHHELAWTEHNEARPPIGF